MDKDEFLKIRKEAGLSQQAMAERLGKSLTAVRSWEKGRVPIDPLYADGIRYRFPLISKENNQ